MALTASAGDSGDSQFETVPPGSYKAVCYRLIDAGTAEEEYQGETNKRHQLYIFWELPEMKTSDDRPMSIFAGYTLSLNERSNLFRDVCAWRNAPFTDEEKTDFDLTSLLGKGCKLNVVLNSNGNAKVASLNAMPTAFDEDEKLRNLPTHNEQEVFDLEEYVKEFSGESNEASKKMCDMVEDLPRFLQWRINGCDEAGKDQVPPCFELAAAMTKGQKKAPGTKKDDPKASDDFEDDIPF